MQDKFNKRLMNWNVCQVNETFNYPLSYMEVRDSNELSRLEENVVHTLKILDIGSPDGSVETSNLFAENDLQPKDTAQVRAYMLEKLCNNQCRAYDTSGGAIQESITPFISNTEKVHPDISMLSAPCYIECEHVPDKTNSIIDPVRDLIIQCCDRVDSQMRAYGYFRRVVALGVCQRSAFVVVGIRRETRSNDSAKPYMHELRISRISRDHVIGLWKLLATQVFNTYFMMDEGPYILTALLKMDLHPAACAVEFLDKSMSEVFSVTIQSTGEIESAHQSKSMSKKNGAASGE
jgi:hypothetical protein